MAQLRNNPKGGFSSPIGKIAVFLATMASILLFSSSALAFSPPSTAVSRSLTSIGGAAHVTRPFHHHHVGAPKTSAVILHASNPEKSFLSSFDKKVTVVLGTIAAAFLVFQCLVVVEAGTIGIASTLGNLEKYDPGPHLRNPLLTSVTTLSTKTELLEQSNFVPTKEGLTVELDTAVLIKLDSEQAIELYKTVGPNYMQKLVAPETSSSVRGLTSESEAKALYTAGRSELQNGMKAELKEKLEGKGILVEDFLLKNVVLPKSLSESIQQKAQAEQESARMEFVLLKESQEAKRKAIEAEGIAEFQRIVAKDISPSLLQWKGIEATERLAKSENSKVVIMGNSKNSLPVILGSDAANAK